MRKQSESLHEEMEIWEQSVNLANDNADKFAIFYHDDQESHVLENQKQSNGLKRQFDGRLEDDNYEALEASIKGFLDTSEGSSDPPINSKPRGNKFQQEKDQEEEELDKRINKEQRSGVYSKNYREKKKEKMKILEQENNFLKKKVDQLQFRLHQTQMQLNRLKYSSEPESKGDINQLNQDLISKLNLVTEADEGSKADKTTEQNQPKSREKQIEQFLQIYDAYGFGGTQVKQLLEYHINEFIENALRDCQKYYFTNWVKNRYFAAQKTSLDYELQEAAPQNEFEQKKNKQISLQVRPLTLELVKSCRQMYQGYKKTMGYLTKIHDMTRFQFQKDFDYALKRVKVAQWLTVNKYSKDARQLRADWIDLIKNQNELWEKEKKSGPKKKIVK